ncbi:Cyclopropane-fatty-acyl-phospholipid synthase [Striga hermonthica]|uniref:Cyclopropane-fatty-acyl-phospholipid synthase n=1 Tax=Striga hermonthica TaxID=68872 RepID=A0A9N7RCK1_STRHE|nr:Cyclopropane-fatty-acyl-phospholipid synthase [Striga hermonthica]
MRCGVKRVAVIGGGISGMMSAYVMAKEGGIEVVVYEKEGCLGGHANTVTVNGTQLDIGFQVFNRVTYPNMMELYESLGVDMEPSDMSFSVSLADGQGCEWGTRSFSSLFAQKKNIFSPSFWKMIREINKFNEDGIKYVEELNNNEDVDRNETLGHFVRSRGYSELFEKAFLIPTCASIWSCPKEIMDLSAYSVLSFLRNHHALQVFDRPQWLTPKDRSQVYVNKVNKELERRGCQVRINSEVVLVSTNDEGCMITCKDGSKDVYDACIIGAHAPDALKMLGDQVTYEESRILGAFKYAYSDIYVHHDKSLMPKNPAAWSAWNFLGTKDEKVYITYWLNAVQNIDDKGLPFFSTLNPPYEPENTLLKWSTSHPIPSVAATKASAELDSIQGKRRIWFCGAYQGYGFHEDGLKAGVRAANSLLRKDFTLQQNPKYMTPSWSEAGARLLVTRFLKQFISTGCLILLEEGGTIFTFEGSDKSCTVKVSLRIHTPQFYWKIAKESDLGLADAYINGDFTFVDKKKGLVNLFMASVINISIDVVQYVLKNNMHIYVFRGWWTPMLFTSVLSSAKYFYKHVSRQNTLTQARKNISQHYDLSNELFSLFLDESMAYSCAVFKTPDEDLKNAQLRKINMLIEKARINKEHHVLEIGCGWGSLAIEIVKRTGCKYTGITLSEKQLQYAELRVKEAGLQDQIEFLLCDYRQLPEGCKYDRIISCEMLEAVGHEYMEEFFRCCETALADNGLFVLQFISIADEKYDEYRLSQGFIKEYIFPGGCLPSLSRVTSAMATASRLSVSHLEDIGIHYYQTLRCWRENLLINQNKILALGFDDKFMRTWEYYFDYCAAGFKLRVLGTYQVVFSRPGDVAAFGRDPLTSTPF